MTFYYDESENELVGNAAFDEEYGYASVDDDTLLIDVDHIMEEGRAEAKLKEIRDAAKDALEANS